MTYFIIIATVFFSISAFPPNVNSIDALRRPDMFHRFLFNPYQVYHRKQYYRLLTHGFLHANWTHLLFNMLTLYFFGTFVEDVFKMVFGYTAGKMLFLGFYLLAIIVSSIPDLIKHKHNAYYNAVGASGAVSAVLFASILVFPKSSIYIFLIPIPIPGYIFAPLYLLYSYYFAQRGGSNIGHNAHFWGAIFGFVFPLLLYPDFLRIFLSYFL